MKLNSDIYIIKKFIKIHDLKDQKNKDVEIQQISFKKDTNKFQLEIKFAHFLAQQKIAFRQSNHLIPFLKENLIDSKIMSKS